MTREDEETVARGDLSVNRPPRAAATRRDIALEIADLEAALLGDGWNPAAVRTEVERRHTQRLCWAAFEEAGLSTVDAKLAAGGLWCLGIGLRAIGAGARGALDGITAAAGVRWSVSDDETRRAHAQTIIGSGLTFRAHGPGTFVAGDVYEPSEAERALFRAIGQGAAR
jgi:hypothetical protein